MAARRGSYTGRQREGRKGSQEGIASRKGKEGIASGMQVCFPSVLSDLLFGWRIFLLPRKEEMAGLVFQRMHMTC